MKSFLLFFLCCCLVLNACTTVEKFLETERLQEWSSSDPLSIPLDIRQAQFKKGNIVVNPSFENGHRETDRLKIEGWQPVGDHVGWALPESEAIATQEVNSGRHAIKIVRTEMITKGDAAGVVSDYLPVIPGNYDFTFYIRLKDIVRHHPRPGLKPDDALDIKALFFDRNKQPIDPQIRFPVRNTLINNSNKNHAFSRLEKIEDFTWSKVRGKSYHYPFSEGDIPDATRYVRLFLGLKGSGTMWIDDIDFRYSKWNFTTLERFRPYFTRQLTLEEKITPKPQHFQQLTDVVYFDARNPEAQPPIIVLPGDPAPAEQSAAVLIQKEINTILGKISPGSTPECSILRTAGQGFSLKDIPATQLLLSIGRNRLYQQTQPDLPLHAIQDKNQGYIIKSSQIGNRHTVFLMGRTPVASYYAAATAVQLLEPERGVYHDATIIDYPDLLSRGFAFRKWQNKKELDRDLENIAGMSRYKLNRVYVGYIPARKIWQHSVPIYLEGIKAAGKLCTAGGTMNLGVMANPYSHFEFFPSAESLSDEDRYLWTHSNPQSFALLQDFFKVGLDAGADTIMYLADDFVPHTGKNSQNYSLYTLEDKNRFGTLANAQAHIINRLKDWIDTDYPGARLEFCPPWYASDFINRSDGEAQKYFKELVSQIPRDVPIVWTGPAVRSLSIDMADIQRYRSLIGRWPMVWDNTLYARSIASSNYGGYTAHYPGKVRMCNLFEPFDTYRPEGFHRYISNGQIYTNGNAYRDTYKVKFATVADYQWNTSAYKPELSLWKVLSRTYGAACAQQLLIFNDAYFGLYQICLRLQAEDAREAYIQQGKAFLKTMAGNLKRIDEASCAGRALLQELESLRDRQKRRFEKLTRQIKNKGRFFKSLP
jgi:hypothetical protein